MKKAIAFLLAAVILSVLSNAAFCEAGVTTLNASGTLNRAVSVDPTGRSEGFSAVIYNNLNGLPTSGANAIAETGEGFIWIGSYAGLIRYDGNTFERMDSTNGITSVRALFVDSRDRLWIGTNANGFAVMDRGEYRIWDMYERLKSSSIRAFAEDNGGNIYVATTSGVARIDADMNMTMLADSQLENAYIRDLRLGGDGLIYGLTWTGDLLKYLDGTRIRSIIRDSADRLWIATWQKHGLICYDHGQVTSYTVDDGLISDRVRVVFERSDELTPDVVDAFLRLVDRGEFRDPDDNGGGSLENIENIHSVLENQSRDSGPLKL